MSPVRRRGIAKFTHELTGPEFFELTLGPATTSHREPDGEWVHGEASVFIDDEERYAAWVAHGAKMAQLWRCPIEKLWGHWRYEQEHE